jgi:hypothetical protein
VLCALAAILSALRGETYIHGMGKSKEKENSKK